MGPFVDTIMDDVSRQHLESGLAQIEVNLARKRERATEDGEQFPAKGGDDFYTAKHGPNGQTAENIQSAKIGIISMETKEAKRLKGSKKTEKAGLREKVQLKRSKKTEKMRKDEQAKLKERKSHKGRKAKSLGQQDDDNINENPEDISMLDQSIAVHQLPKPNKETRIVPMKVGDFWEYITLGESGQKSKEPPQEKNSPLSISSTLPMKRGLISSTETEYGSNETRRKRTKTATGDEMIPTPTPRARRKQPPGEFESQHGKTLVQIGKELTDDQNGAQSPSCSNATSGTSSSWSDSPLIDALRASLGHNEVHGDGTLDSGRGTTLKDEYKQVPDTWQEYPGKIRGRLETSEDLEVEENLAFSARYLADNPMGVTISSIHFKTVTLAPGTKFVFDGAKDATLRIASVGQGTVEVTMCSKTFSLQMGGMWRVRGPEKCSVKNLGVEEAVVHVSSR